MGGLTVVGIVVAAIAMMGTCFWALDVFVDMDVTGLSFGRVMAQRRLDRYERELKRRARAERSEARIKKQETRISESKYL